MVKPPSVQQLQEDLNQLLRLRWHWWRTWLTYERHQRGMTHPTTDGMERFLQQSAPEPPPSHVDTELRGEFESLVQQRFLQACEQARAEGQPEPARSESERAVIEELWKNLFTSPATVWVRGAAMTYDREADRDAVLNVSSHARETHAKISPVQRMALIGGVGMLALVIFGLVWWVVGASSLGVTPSSPLGVPDVRVAERAIGRQLVAIEGPANPIVRDTAHPLRLCSNDTEAPPTITMTWIGYQRLPFRAVYLPATSGEPDLILSACDAPTTSTPYRLHQWTFLSERDDLVADMEWAVDQDLVTWKIITERSWENVTMMFPDATSISPNTTTASETTRTWIFAIPRDRLIAGTKVAVWGRDTTGTMVRQNLEIPDMTDDALIGAWEPPIARVVQPTIGPPVLEITIVSPTTMVLPPSAIVLQTSTMTLPALTSPVTLNAGKPTTITIPLHESIQAIRIGTVWEWPLRELVTEGS